MDELTRLSNEILETIYKEDLEHDFRNGGMYREKCKAKQVQTHNK